MVRCKACGYIMKEGELGDRCPACGAPRSAFEPYTDPISPRRRAILKRDLHPIATHFPIAFVASSLVFSIAALIFSAEARGMLITTTKILTLLVPLLVIITFFLGIWDGRIRFRKISNSQILKKKIIYASCLFVTSVALALVIWIGDFNTIGFTVGAILLSALALGLIIPLAILGVSILEAAFPGK